jgi:GTP-binding protein LepA
VQALPDPSDSRTAKTKLLEKQKEGKKRMRQFGKVEMPRSAFAALKMGDG